MTDAAAMVTTASDHLVPTPNQDDLPRRFSSFATFGEALDYAAQGNRGVNFHDPRGNLARVYPFRELREDALVMARRLIAHGIGKGDRFALVAETGPEFAALFCGTIYAGAWPVPLPLPTRPTIALTFCTSTRKRAASRPTEGWLVSSRTTNSTWQPFTPPALADTDRSLMLVFFTAARVAGFFVAFFIGVSPAGA